MNAEEARKKASEHDYKEINEIIEAIKKAANKGESRIVLDRSLRDGTQKWLKENGYNYRHTHEIIDPTTGEHIITRAYISWH